MENTPNILIAQSFVISPAEEYWDYRDYIFCMVSNLAIKDCPFRLNIERGTEFGEEMRAAARGAIFTDTVITEQMPISWSEYMLSQMRENPSTWVMPWPGDHIYIHQDQDAFVKSLQKAETLGADAVAYGHVQDFEYFLDWDRVKVLYNDPEYVMIEWGNDYRYYRNPRLKKAAKKIVRQELIMVPVPGFVTYRSELMGQILEALPAGNKRWQDMEYSTAPAAAKFKLLIPKQCLYRHVHGYWFEGFLKYSTGGVFPMDVKAEINTWYIRPQYDWKTNSPTRDAYRENCLKQHPYFVRYLCERKAGDFPNSFGGSPFDAGWKPANAITSGLYRSWKYAAHDLPRQLAATVRSKIN